MILTGKQILKEIKEDRILINPFYEKNINPDSYDISIGESICFYQENSVLNSKNNNVINTIKIPVDGLILEKNKFYFAETMETIHTLECVPMLHSKSGIARLGMFTHITADLLDVGHNGKVWLQIYPTNSVKIYPNQKVAQISFWKIQK